MKLIDHVKGTVNFVHYQDGNLVYVTESGLEFPVPISDCGSARFENNDKAILFMRWIRKHLETLKEGNNDN